MSSLEVQQPSDVRKKRKHLLTVRTLAVGVFFYIFIFSFFLFPDILLAAEQSGLATFLGLPSGEARFVVLRIFQIVWGVGGIAGIALSIYGFIGFRNASLEEDLTEQARTRRYMILGGLIAAISFVIFGVVTFFLSSALDQYAKRESPSLSGEVSRSVSFGEFQSRFSRVERHYPGRDEKNIPRNVAILVTFRTAIDIKSVQGDDGKLRASSIRIYEISPTPTPEGQSIVASVNSVDEGKTLKLTPERLLGEPGKKALYGVLLSPEIRTPSGDSLFGNTGGYSWQFEVSGIVDSTPPTVENAFPVLPSGELKGIPKNALIQITFSEPVDPTLVTGNKVTVFDQSKARAIEGSFILGNQYRSLTFVPRASCGTNACQETVYCLPESTDVKVTLKAATLLSERTPDNPFRSKFPYDGIVDVAGNSLDGGGERGASKNGKSEGSPVDDFTFLFHTTDTMQSGAPSILSIAPTRDTSRVPLDAPIDVTFTRLMDVNSLHQGSLFLGNDLNYWITATHDTANQRTRARVNHDPFRSDAIYQPEIRSEVHDVFQNCFNPCLGPTP